MLFPFVRNSYAIKYFFIKRSTAQNNKNHTIFKAKTILLNIKYTLANVKYYSQPLLPSFIGFVLPNNSTTWGVSHLLAFPPFHIKRSSTLVKHLLHRIVVNPCVLYSFVRLF